MDQRAVGGWQPIVARREGESGWAWFARHVMVQRLVAAHRTERPDDLEPPSPEAVSAAATALFGAPGRRLAVADLTPPERAEWDRAQASGLLPPLPFASPAGEPATRVPPATSPSQGGPLSTAGLRFPPPLP